MAKHMRRLGRHSRERGMAIIFYATMLFFVIGCVGLAVDVGTIYMIKARLSSAADAAALAAGRSVNLALTIGQAQSNAITTANQFFAANFPNGYFNTIGFANRHAAPDSGNRREWQSQRRPGYSSERQRQGAHLLHEYLQCEQHQCGC